MQIFEIYSSTHSLNHRGRSIDYIKWILSTWGRTHTSSFGEKSRDWGWHWTRFSPEDFKKFKVTWDWRFSCWKSGFASFWRRVADVILTFRGWKLSILSFTTSLFYPSTTIMCLYIESGLIVDQYWFPNTF